MGTLLQLNDAEAVFRDKEAAKVGLRFTADCCSTR